MSRLASAPDGSMSAYLTYTPSAALRRCTVRQIDLCEPRPAYGMHSTDWGLGSGVKIQSRDICAWSSLQVGGCLEIQPYWTRAWPVRIHHANLLRTRQQGR